MDRNFNNCIVYGGGGFIGSHLCESLIRKGYNVILFDKINFSRKNVSHFEGKINIIEGDFNNEIDLKNSLNNIDYVYHLVSSTLPASSNENTVYDAESNLLSSLKLFRACIKKEIKKVIFLSSGGTVYGIPKELPIKESFSSNPICSYGIIKKTIEEYLSLFKKINNLEYNVFRLSNPYGQRQNPFASQGAIAVFIYNVINDKPIEIWGDGEVIRDYIFIQDTIDILTRSIEINSEEKVFNLSSGTGYSLNQIIEIIKKISGKEVKVNYNSGRNLDVPVNILDNTLVKKIFNWTPNVNIEEGIKITFDYLSQIKS